MKKWRRLFSAVFMLAMLATLMPAENVQAAKTAPGKLSVEDFVKTYPSGEKSDFLEQSKDNELYYSFTPKFTDTKGENSTLKTNRNVKLGSTEAFVKKQYGNAAKVKAGKKDKFYKLVKYEYPAVDISIWKNYLEYTYKNGSDNYIIRFYLNKKNKVVAIVYTKNLDQFYEYPNKEATAPKLTFQAPKGKKITTKKINGKKVYMLPRGTKIKKTGDSNYASWLGLYDENGDLMARSADGVYYDLGDDLRLPFLVDYESWADKKKNHDLESVINATLSNQGENEEDLLNFDNLGEYLFFNIEFFAWEEGLGAPKNYYFKFV